MIEGVDVIDIFFINPRDISVPQPYLKLCSYAAVIKDVGIKFDLIEPGASNISYAQILSAIRLRKPKVICVAVLPSTLPDAYEMIQLIKAEFTNKTIVLEGYHVNADPSIILSIGADYGIRGDGEYSFAKLCKHLINDEAPPLEDIEGLVYVKNGELKTNKMPVIRDINLLPLPTYELLPIGKYYSASTTKKFMTLVTTRGCPYECNFCSSSLQMNYRWLNVENTLKQLTFLVKDLGVEWVEFMDLTFTMSRQRVLDICNAIINEQLVFDWGCETRVDKLDETLLLKMKEAGCKKVTFGVESGVEKIRSQSGKNISNREIKDIFDLCRKNGVKTMANFIFGHPGETAIEMKETVRFAHELDSFNVLFTRMLPLPDVEIYKKGVESCEIDKDVWVKYMLKKAEFPVYCPSTISRQKLEQIHRYAYLSYYFSPRQILKYLPMFTDLKFVITSFSVFLRLAFGKTAFK